jgi:mannan endo-1,4-beta-mannosidase
MTFCGLKRSVRGLLGGVLGLACFVVGLGTAARWETRPASISVASFVTRSGDKLMLNGRVYRFAGANIYWGGLDQSGRAGINYPTPFRVEAGLQTVADMGETVVRCMTCGISTGNPLSVEPRLGQFNETAERYIDYFVAQAQKYGIRLVIPLTANYSFYEGGYCNFTDWLGLSKPSDCPSPAAATAFYTSPRAIAAFEKYISVLLNHVNYYTGMPNKDDPTIMAWETGDELTYGLGGAREFTRWTGRIAAYLKSLAPHQLVMDGALSLDPGDLALSDVDIQDQHLYPISIGKANYLAARVAVAKQAFVVGEYGWNNASKSDGLVPFLADIERTNAISGDIYWDLLPQNDFFGFEEHYDGYQLHFPGDDEDVGTIGAVTVLAPVSDAPLVADLRHHAYAMAGVPVPSYPVPWAPVITDVEHVASATEGTGNLVEWRGSPGAASYVIRRSTRGPGGPWTTAGTVSAAATEAPFLDRGADPGPRLWYEVAVVNPSGAAGPASPPYQVVDQTLDDNLDGFSETADHTPGVTLDTSHAGRYGGDRSRAEFPAGQAAESVTWHVPVLQTVEALAYYEGESPEGIGFLLSVNGTTWTQVPASDVQLNQVLGTFHSDSVCYIYTIDDVQRILTDANYVRVQPHTSASGVVELGEVRITYP